MVAADGIPLSMVPIWASVHQGGVGSPSDRLAVYGGRVVYYRRGSKV